MSRVARRAHAGCTYENAQGRQSDGDNQSKQKPDRVSRLRHPGVDTSGGGRVPQAACTRHTARHQFAAVQPALLPMPCCGCSWHSRPMTLPLLSVSAFAYLITSGLRFPASTDLLQPVGESSPCAHSHGCLCLRADLFVVCMRFDYMTIVTYALQNVKCMFRNWLLTNVTSAI